MSLLSLKNLRVRIPAAGKEVIAVRGVSLHVDAGELVGIVGESGCGKSVTAMTIAGLGPEGAIVTADEFTVAGHEILTANQNALRRLRRQDVGVVFQNPMKALNPRLLVGSQIREALKPADRSTARSAYLKSIELLDSVGVNRAAERLRQYPHELSGGLAQRVVIALALARNPKLLIADEPTTALDVSVQAQILNLLDRLRRELDLGVILVSHDLEVVRDRANRVAVMYAGRVVESGPTMDVIDRPGHPYTAALVAAMPNVGRDEHEPLVGLEGLPPPLTKPIQGCALRPRCPLATEICAVETPVLRALDTTGHCAACFNNNGSVVSLPKSTTSAATRVAAPRNARSILSVENVNKAFHQSGLLPWSRVPPNLVAQHVSLDVRLGEALGIVGESGSGKTTLARMLVGLETPDSGTIRFDGTPIGELSAEKYRQWREDIQFIFQDNGSALDPRYTVAESVAEPLQIRGATRQESLAKAVRLLGEVGLGEGLAHRRPFQLSGGQRQRVGIARALSLDPKVIIADEPVSALDVSIQATILNLLNHLRAERDVTYVVISHDLGVIRYVCTHIAVMSAGEIVEAGPVDQVLTHPQHPYTRKLLAAVPGGGNLHAA